MISGNKALCSHDDSLVSDGDWFREILESLPDIVQCYNAKGECLYVSQSFRRIFGRDPPELHHAHGLDFIHSEDRQRVREALGKLKHADSVTYRYRVLLPTDGVTRWFEATSRPLRHDEDGRVAETVVVSRDITQQIEAEEALRDSDYEFRRVLENITDVVCRFSDKMECLYVSPSLKQILGLDPSEMVGKVIGNWIHPEDVGAATAAFERLIASKVPETFTNRAVHSQSGRLVWLETTMRATRWYADGRFAEGLAVSRDVTSRKEVERALEEALVRAEAASAAKSRFLANMSHELRTPLNAVLGFSELIRRETLGPISPVPYREYIDLIYSSGSHLLDLISDVLDLSRVEAGKVNLRIEAFDLLELITSCLRLVDVRAKQAKLMLLVGIEPGLNSICADRRSLFQIIINLLTNAIKFTPAGGAVTISAAKRSNGIMLRVEDTGVGIASDDLSRLTLPFEQGAQDPYLAQGGAGLGLALVKSLIELHQGTLEIESTVGRGTIVTVCLPQQPTALEL